MARGVVVRVHARRHAAGCRCARCTAPHGPGKAQMLSVQTQSSCAPHSKCTCEKVRVQPVQQPAVAGNQVGGVLHRAHMLLRQGWGVASTAQWGAWMQPIATLQSPHLAGCNTCTSQPGRQPPTCNAANSTHAHGPLIPTRTRTSPHAQKMVPRLTLTPASRLMTDSIRSPKREEKNTMVPSVAAAAGVVGQASSL